MTDKDLRITTCPVCGSKRFQPVRTIAQYSIVRCLDCRVEVTTPQPTNQALAAIYGASYFIGADDPVLAARASDLKRATAARYLALVARKAMPPGRRLLELGSGHGDFLVEAAGAGFEVTGVEYSEHACEVIRNRLGSRGSVVRGEIDAVADRTAGFDLVVLNDVIEHVREPASLLATLHKILGPAGVLFIATPSIDSWSARLLGRRWMEYKEEHLTYFGQRQLARLLGNNGYDVLDVASGAKILSLEYVTQHFAHYPVPLITPVLGFLNRMLPDSWSQKKFSIVASGMTVIARRRDPQAHGSGR